MTSKQIQSTLGTEDLGLSELIMAIWRGKIIIFGVSMVFAIGAVFYALSLPNIYKSEVTLAPVTEQSGLQIPGQIGGLAALAGVNLSGMGGGDKTGVALEILKSRDFIGRFISDNDLYIPIMAAKGWSRANDELILNPEIYDENAKQWVRNVESPFLPKPSTQETFEAFKKLFKVSQDKTTGMVKLSVEHFSPFLSKVWADKLVKAINEEMRSRELQEAERSIEYLNRQVELTNIADVRTMLYSLIEEQTKTVMLANVRDEYVFKTIDPAIVSETKDKPARALIVVLAVLLGGMLSVIIVLVRYFNCK